MNTMDMTPDNQGIRYPLPTAVPYKFRNITQALPILMDEVIGRGAELGSRNGRVKEVLYPHITLTQPWEREVLNGARAASLPAQIAETMWLLAGRDDIGWLSHYLPRAADFSDDGSTWRGAYGKRLRDYPGGPVGVDQLAQVVRLLQEDPTTRRAVMSIYDPTQDFADSKDVPCNNWLHFLSREGHLHLHVTIRSNDLMWGWSGINAFEWSALQEIVAGLLGLRIGELHFSISSLHLYEPYWSKAKRIADEPRGAFIGKETPRFQSIAVSASASTPAQRLARLDELVTRWFELEFRIREGYNPVSDIEAFPEPMMRSWLHVLNWWWVDRSQRLHSSVEGTRLATAARLSPQGPWSPERHTNSPCSITPVVEPDAFTEFVVALHADKHAAYGDSWKRRGEQIGIMANIARKVDRLGVAGGGDTSADTVIDLLVYLVKYRLWLSENTPAPLPEAVQDAEGAVTDDPQYVEAVLRSLPFDNLPATEIDRMIKDIQHRFDRLERVVTKQVGGSKGALVNYLIAATVPLARTLWIAEELSKPADVDLAEHLPDTIPEAAVTAITNATRQWAGYDDELS